MLGVGRTDGILPSTRSEELYVLKLEEIRAFCIKSAKFIQSRMKGNKFEDKPKRESSYRSLSKSLGEGEKL